MSYCRWSSMNWQCDVYVYESNNGFECHVASRRRQPVEGRDIPKIDYEDASTMLEGWKRQSEWLNDESNWEWVQVPEPYGGESYTLCTPGELADLMTTMKEAGLNVPQYAIDVLKEEQDRVDEIESEGDS